MAKRLKQWKFNGTNDRQYCYRVLTAIGLSLIFSLIGVSHPGKAISVGLILGVLIVFPAMLSDSMFCGWGNQLLLIQAGYRIVSVLLMLIVFCLRVLN